MNKNMFGTALKFDSSRGGGAEKGKNMKKKTDYVHTHNPSFYLCPHIRAPNIQHVYVHDKNYYVPKRCVFVQITTTEMH